MRSPSLIIILGVMLVALLLPTNVHASTLAVSVSPPQTISQGQTATYAITFATPFYPNMPYALSVSGVVGSFSPNPVTDIASVFPAVNLVADASTTPTYCPGTYSFLVTASGGTPPDTATIPGVLTVTQAGPPLQVAVFTDKPTYRVGDIVTLSISVTRPAEGQLIISGTAMTYPFASTSAGSGPIASFHAQTVGTYTVTAQADDYCTGASSAQTTFTISPNTYDVSVSTSGVPSQYSSALQVDGHNQGTIQGSQPKQLSFPIGSTHTIMVDQYVAGASGVRYYASQNSWSVSSTDSHTFTYQTQYQLIVATDPSGVTPTTGGGWYNDGQSVQTNQAPPTVAGPSGTQYAFKNWELDGAAQSGNQLTVMMNLPHSAVAKYSTQYQLVVDSPGGLGNPQGAGYYDAGSTATFSVTSPVGFLVQQVLVQWQGDYTGTNPQGTVTMDKSRTVHAVWTTSLLQAYIAGGILAVVIIAVAILIMRRRKGGTKAAEPAKKKGLGLRIGKLKRTRKKTS